MPPLIRVPNTEEGRQRIKDYKEAHRGFRFHVRGRHPDRIGLFRLIEKPYSKYSQNDVPLKYSEELCLYYRWGEKWLVNTN